MSAEAIPSILSRGGRPCWCGRAAPGRWRAAQRVRSLVTRIRTELKHMHGADALASTGEVLCAMLWRVRCPARWIATAARCYQTALK